MDRTGLDFNLSLRNKNSSHCHLDIIHGGGASPFETAELLKDLRGLGKPPSFDGNDAEYQDFRFSFRTHTSLVSSVSHELMDRCEIERSPISLTAVRALGEAHLKCCMQMYYALALITRGILQTLTRSVEETNGGEAWRLSYTVDTRQTLKNPQYALMQKIMMPAKPWCDHTEGFLNRTEILGAGRRRMGTSCKHHDQHELE